MIKEFTIFGERNSGTTYLENILKKNLKICFTKKYGSKHWFIKDLPYRSKKNTTTDNECIESLNKSDNTLFIFIIRNPYDWVGAMFNRIFHIPNADKTTIYNFISKKHISYENYIPKEHRKGSLTEWFINKETNNYFIEEAENLIELRNLKNKHFYNLKNIVKNFYIIRQEHLRNDIENMIKKYNLILKNKKFNFFNYRSPKKYSITDKSKKFIDENLNNDIDNMFYN